MEPHTLALPEIVFLLPQVPLKPLRLFNKAPDQSLGCYSMLPRQAGRRASVSNGLLMSVSARGRERN